MLGFSYSHEVFRGALQAVMAAFGRNNFYVVLKATVKKHQVPRHADEHITSLLNQSDQEVSNRLLQSL